MTITATGRGRGYTQEEALENWLMSDQFDSYGIGRGHAALDNSKPILVVQIKKPKTAARARVDRLKQIGSRKWKISYEVRDATGAFFHPTSRHDTQAEAIDLAKTLSLETHTIHRIYIIKELVHGSPLVAEITPGSSHPGEWEFTASFQW